MLVRQPYGGNVYTDPMLLDVAGALEALPELALGINAGKHGATGCAPMITRSWRSSPS